MSSLSTKEAICLYQKTVHHAVLLEQHGIRKACCFTRIQKKLFHNNFFLYPGTVQAGIEPAVVISNSTNTCNPMDSEDLNLLVALHKRGKGSQYVSLQYDEGEISKKHFMNLSYIVCQKSMRNSNFRTVLFVYHR